MRLLKQQSTNLRNINGSGVKLDIDNQVIMDTDNSLIIPKGGTDDRPPVPHDGQTRYNTDTLKFEYYENGDWINSIDSASQVYYVSQSGSDNYNGKTIGSAFRTIDYALTAIPEGSTLHVKAGDYTLNNPVIVPKKVGIVGDSLRTVTVRAGNTTQDMFYVNNGSYLTQMTFKDHEYPSAAVAFNPDGSAGEIFQSPYVQNCTSITTTGTGMRVDGRHADGLKSMVVDAFTQYNQGGTGIHMLYLGNTQLVSVFTICCEVAILCENGGFCSLTNSNSSFGTFGLKANGVSQAKYYGTVAQTITNPTFGGDSILINNLRNRPYSGDAVAFGNGADQSSEYYTVSTASELKIGKTRSDEPEYATQSPDYVAARNTVLSAKDTIVFETIQNLNNTYPNLDYDQSKCARDLKIIIDSVTSDMVFGTNYRTVIAGRSYYQNSASEVIDNQLTETVSAIEDAKTKTLSYINSGTTEYNRISDNFDEILDILNNGIANADTIVFPNPNGVTSAEQRAIDILDANRSFIEEEGIAFISQNYPSLTYDEPVCRRDIRYVIDAIKYDILYKGNSQSLVAAQQYFSGGSLQVGADEKTATIETFKYLKTVTESVLLNITVAKINSTQVQDFSNSSTTIDIVNKTKSLYDIISAYLEDGNYINDFFVIEDPDFSNQEEDRKTIKNTLIAAKSKLQVDTINFINKTFPTLQYDQSKCSRDVGLILQAVIDDMMFETNYKTVIAGKSYYRASASEVISAQKTATVSALEFLRDNSLNLISDNSTTEEPEYNTISNNFDSVIAIINNGVGSAPALTYPSPEDSNTNQDRARDIVQANRQFLIEEGIAYISQNHSSLTYNETKCREDLGFIVDAITYDITYAGNSQTADAAGEYYSAGTLQIPTDQKEATLGTYKRLKQVASDCVTNTPVNALQNSETQIVSLPPAATDQADIVEDLFDIVIRILDKGYVSEVTLDETINESDIISGTDISFHQYSLITASGHTFEWVGAGTNVNSALPYEGGRPVLENQVIEENGGRIYYTATDQEGDFRIGGDLTINRTTGTIEGNTFDRSLFAVLTPYILAIED
jgi:hypothetical protein